MASVSINNINGYTLSFLEQNVINHAPIRLQIVIDYFIDPDVKQTFKFLRFHLFVKF